MKLLDLVIYTGTFVFAIAGALKGRAARTDIFGGIVLAFVTAYGGGTLRDLLIGIRPVNWINDNIALGLVGAGTLITLLLKENVNRFRRTIFFTDAIGLGTFTTWGIEVSQRNGLNDIYSLIMGVITATFGGLIADILCAQVPSLMKRGELYATACAIGGGIYLLLKHVPVEPKLNMTICVLIIVLIRIYSYRKKVTLPEI
jgi:uncharacterized membrane protein YeiH